MIKKIKKDGYTIEYFENNKYNEKEMNEIIGDSLTFLKRKETKDVEMDKPYLVHKEGTIVKEGDEVVDFRGDKAIVIGWQAPAFKGKSGRVYVKEILKDGGEFEAGYYPQVYDLYWKNLSWDKEVEDVFVEDK